MYSILIFAIIYMLKMNDNKVKNILSNDKLIEVVASSLTIVYGITSLVSKKDFNNKSGEIVNLSNDKLNEGIFIKKRGNKYTVVVYVSISKDVKKEEVESQIVTQVTYDLHKKFKINSKDITVTPNSVVK